MAKERPTEKIARLERWIADLQSGMYVNCVYCGHQYGPGETTPMSMADALKAHIATCPQHPMHRLIGATQSAYHALRSYQYGNGAGDLAKEVADNCRDALVEAGVRVTP